MKRSTWRLLSQIFLGICVVISMLILYVVQPLPLQWTDYRIYDFFLRHQDPGQASPIPAIIDIDEKSLAILGQWPWPRYQIAQLIEIISNSGALAIGLDILLSEPDQTSPLLVQKNLANNFNVYADLTSIPSAFQDNDLLLSQVLQHAPAVTGIFMNFKQDIEPNTVLPPPGINIIEQKSPQAIPAKEHLIKAKGMTLPLPMFMKTTPVGFINATPDVDGIIRSLPLLAILKDKIYPSMALRTLMMALKVKNIILKTGLDGLESIKIGPYTVPVSPNGLYYILYRGPHGVYPYFSAVDILQGKVTSQELAGKILFLGTSASGLLDIRSTPFDPIYPGVENHAALVDSILTQHHLISPPWAPGAQFIAIVLLGIICTFIFSLARPSIYFAVALSLIIIILGCCFYLFTKGYYLTPLYSLLCIITMAVSLLLLRFWQVDKQKYFLQNAFSKYVSPEVVNRISNMNEDILQGESKLITIIFTDIRGFTSISEKLNPEQLVKLLNRYFTPMTSLIIKNGGTVDKFIGDAIMAFWNAPLDVPGHPFKALETVLAMQESLSKLNISLKTEYGIELKIGAGVHTGIVHVGNMGSAELLDYTCIGDNVNLASRLEGLCSKYGVTTITSAVTKELCETYLAEMAQQFPDKSFSPKFYFRHLDNIRVKGKTQPVAVFFVLPAEEYLSRSQEFTQADYALEHYIQGNFTTAQQLFLDLIKKYSDNKMYMLYESRCITLIESPPQDWDGVWDFLTK